MRAATGMAALTKAGFKPALLVVVSATLLAGLAGCGTRGNLETPAAEKAADTTASADSGQGKPEGTALKPHKPFILDPILR